MADTRGSCKKKLLSTAVVMSLVLGVPLTGMGAATVCNNGAPATIDAGNCTVQAGTIPTTVNFETGTAGILRLNGAAPTDATTNTTINEGTVMVIGSTSSASTFGVGGGGSLLSFQVSDGVTFGLGHDLAALTVAVGGMASAALNQTAGTLTATNLNITQGSTFTQSGTGVANATAITIDSGSTLTLVNQGTGTIDGAGGAGNGILVFNGDYNTDAAIGGTNSLASITVNDGKTLTLDQNASATTFHANGTTNQSAGTLAATTLNVGAGDTFTQTGMGSGVINATTITIGAGGTLTLANQGTGTIDGAGGAGNGALVFDGDYNTDAGIGTTTNSLNSITVNAGKTLTLDQALAATTFTISGTVAKSTAGAITAATTINDGGTMNVAASFGHTGNLTVGGGASGTLDVTTSSISVAGTFNMAAGSTFKTTINSATTAGNVVATNVAINATSIIDINVASAAAVNGSSYTIISGAGVTAPTTTIIDNSAGLDFVASIVGNDLTITARTADALQTGLSTNASAVNAPLNTMLANDPTLAAAFAGLTTATQFNQALESLMPDMNGAALSVPLAINNAVSATIDKRLAGLRTGKSEPIDMRLASLDIPPGMVGYSSTDNVAKGVSMWLQGFGTMINQDDRNGIAGYDAGTAGGTIGLDTGVNDVRVGAAYSFSSTDIDTNNSPNTTTIKAHQGSIYASYTPGGFFLNGDLAYSFNNHEGERHVLVGAVKRIASSDYDSGLFSARVNMGYDLGLSSAFFLTPYAGLYYNSLDIDGYTETGAGASNLRVQGENSNSLQSNLGMSVWGRIETTSGSVVPEIHAGWLHDYDTDAQTNTATFTGGGASFKTTGFKPADDSLNLGAALSIYSGDNFAVKASYDFEKKSDYDSHSGVLSLRFVF